MAGFTNAVYNKNRLPMRVRELARMVIALDNECVVCQNTRDSEGIAAGVDEDLYDHAAEWRTWPGYSAAGADRGRVRGPLRQRPHRPARRRGLLGPRKRAFQRRAADRPGAVVRDVVGHGTDAADAGHRPNLQDHAVIHPPAAQNGCCDIGSQTPRRSGHRPTRVRRGRHPHRHGRQPCRAHPRQDHSAPENGRVRRPGTGRQPGLARLRHRPDRHRVRRGHRRGRRPADPHRSGRAAHPRRRIGLGTRRFLRSGRRTGSLLQSRSAGPHRTQARRRRNRRAGRPRDGVPARRTRRQPAARPPVGAVRARRSARVRGVRARRHQRGDEFGRFHRAVPPRVRDQPVRDITDSAVADRRGGSAAVDEDHRRQGRQAVRPAGQPVAGAVRRQRGIRCTPTLFAAEGRQAAVLRRLRRTRDDAGGGVGGRRAGGRPARSRGRAVRLHPVRPADAARTLVRRLRLLGHRKP